jgi:hypothetical protein
VRDGVKLARRGVPAVALVTEKFWAQGDFVARSVGMPDIPRTRLPHPVAGSGHENMRKVASHIAPDIIASLSGRGRP